MRIKNYEKLKEEFDKEAKQLQKICKHKRTTWMEQWWAIGHSTGKEVEVCNCCNKMISERDLK